MSITINYKGNSITNNVNFTLPSFEFNIKSIVKKYNSKGNLTYEYNPFRNFRDSNTGELKDLDTELLQFDLSHPVNIETQTSYDGSVNLILNDDKNQPRLINSRFTVLENDTYEIVDRDGNNDSNIYDADQFEIDTSLYKKTTTIPRLDFKGLLPNGSMPVGNYNFFFKYVDADGNETDFIEESGLVTCHIGHLNDPFSIQSGLLNENSNKSIEFVLSNLDGNYEYIRVYYIRSTSDESGVELTKGYMIDKNYIVKQTAQNILITGYENTVEVSMDVFNTMYNVCTAVKAQAQCQNMLFFGNIDKPTIDYKELKDLSLHFLPTLDDTGDIGNVDSSYKDPTGGYEYYNVLNIYNKVGYWDEEIYRLGVVYILNDNTLSPVFDIRGRCDVDLRGIEQYSDIPLLNNGDRNYISIDEETGLLINKMSPLENGRGVIRIKSNSAKTLPVLGIKIGCNSKVLSELSKHVKGYFFVRQKRIPTILAQALVIGGTKRGLPSLKITNAYYPVESHNYIESFIKMIPNDNWWNRYELTQNFNERFGKVSPVDIIAKAAICPEYNLKQSLYNNFFTGDELYVKTTSFQPRDFKITPQLQPTIQRSFVVKEYVKDDRNIINNIKIATSIDSGILVKIDDQVYRGSAGSASEAWKYINFTASEADGRARGNFGPYLCLNQDKSNIKIDQNNIINIYTQGYSENSMSDYFNTRMSDNSPYYSISRRIAIPSRVMASGIITNTVYRGDCYLCNYTHRMNRNFRDSETPINDAFVDVATYRNNYHDKDKWSNINRSDLNAINMGHWITFKVYSTINLSMRNSDSTNVNEYAISQKPRHFYPAFSFSASSESNMPESFVTNEGLYSSTSKKPYFLLPSVPSIKNNFATRILYSDIHVTDAFKNGYRNFTSSHYKDYTPNYGGITKLIEFAGSLICVFEKGIVLIPVNERAIAGEGAGGNVYINTSNVLPDNPNVVSDTFGSQWSESVLKTSSYIYGVDTIGKKIWRVGSDGFDIISDFKIQKFLNDNISFTEREKTPVIGLKNVKTHYNKFKHDVMFTFYDDLKNHEERVWNICYNEITQKWTTFYSWLPSYSANINNLFFSFDRTTSKYLSKYWNCTRRDLSFYIDDVTIKSDTTKIGTFNVSNYNKIDKNSTLSIELDQIDIKRDGQYFEIQGFELHRVDYLIPDKFYQIDVFLIEERNGFILKKSRLKLVIAYEDSINHPCENTFENLTTYFYKHGQAGIIDSQDKIKPCFWYDKQHPFEFEFVMADNPTYHKIFENLQIISNKEAPESFHYEIIGECYDFANDKKNMYFRQEATKHMYQYNNYDILYNPNYLDITPDYNNKSTLFPSYYSRIDNFEDLYDSYQNKLGSGNQIYYNLSGSEIVYDELLKDYKIATHIKAMDIKKYGRLRGNMNYQEDNWIIQIPSINLLQNNEKEWNYPPINLANNPFGDIPLSIEDNSYIPNKLIDLNYTVDNINDAFGFNKWSFRKEVKQKDRFIKIKVRYTGNNLAIISAIKSIYKISYS